MILASFHALGNVKVVIDRFMIWFKAGSISAMTNFKVLVSISSKLVDLEFFRLVKIYITSSG